MNALTLDDARKILEGAAAHGERIEAKPLTIAVLDAGGHLVAFWRQDGSSTLRPQVAMGKAATCIGLGMSSRKAAEAAKERPEFFDSVTALAQGKVVAAAGGVFILGDRDEVLGAVGISGDLSDRDEACAIAGIETAGFKAAV